MAMKPSGSVASLRSCRQQGTPSSDYRITELVNDHDSLPLTFLLVRPWDDRRKEPHVAKETAVASRRDRHGLEQGREVPEKRCISERSMRKSDTEITL
jgi:hypothetical protein